MNQSTGAVLFWTPRILTLMFAVFLAMLSLDVFGHGRGVWGTLLALTLHLIPAAAVLALLAAAWRRPWFGAAVYLALGVLYLVVTGGRFPWQTYLAVSGALILVGLLFLADALHRRHRLLPL